jgi:hypothetical protein
VTILGNLEGRRIHGIELYVVSALVVYHLVGEYTPAIGDWVARAFLVEGDPLRGSSVKLVNGHYSSLVYAVGGVCVPIVLRGVLGDCLRLCLLIREETLGQLPLDFEGLPSLIKGYNGMSPLGWNATFMENHIDVIFTPLGVKVDRVPHEGLGQEVCSSPVGGTLLLLWGGVDVNYLLPNVKCNIQKIPGHQSRVTYKKYLHQQFSVTYKKYLVMSQGILPLFSKDAMWVKSILLCRNHYYTPIPTFVLNNIHKIPGHQ